jgi:hypothetical protein
MFRPGQYRFRTIDEQQETRLISAVGTFFANALVVDYLIITRTKWQNKISKISDTSEMYSVIFSTDTENAWNDKRKLALPALDVLHNLSQIPESTHHHLSLGNNIRSQLESLLKRLPSTPVKTETIRAGRDDGTYDIPDDDEYTILPMTVLPESPPITAAAAVAPTARTILDTDEIDFQKDLQELANQEAASGAKCASPPLADDPLVDSSPSTSSPPPPPITAMMMVDDEVMKQVSMQAI